MIVVQTISYWLDESFLLRLDPNEELDEKDSILLNSTSTPPKMIIEVPTESYVDSLHESSRNRRDILSMFNDQGNEFDDKKINNLDSVTVKRNPTSDNEVSIQNYVDDSIGEGTLLRFNQTLENYLEVSVGNDTYNLTKYDKIKITDVTEIKYPNTNGFLLQNWVIKCNDRNNNGEKPNFIKSTRKNSPTGYSGATSLPPIATSFMYIKTSSNIHGKIVFVFLELTGTFQISNITFYYKRFSIITNDSLKAMGKFIIQLLLEDNNWSTRYNIPKNDRYSDSSTE